jgi:long-chain acyl-CoA synthetase
MTTYPHFINLLEAHKQYAPDALAVITKHKKITYQQLFYSVEQIASNFIHFLAPQQRVVLHLPNSLELLYAYLACFMANIIAVPISIGAKTNEICTIIERTQATCILTHSHLWNELSSIHWGYTSIKQGFIVGEVSPSMPLSFSSFEDLLTANSQTLPPLPNSSEKAVIFFTSGSTGHPKGIVHTHASLSAMAANIVYCGDITNLDSFLVSEAMTNASGFTHVIAALSQRAKAILLDDFSELMSSIRHYKPTLLCIMGKGNYDIIQDPTLSSEDFASVRVNLTGGDKITKNLLLDFKAKTAVPLRQGYGMSEILCITQNKSEDTNKLGSIGTVTQDVSIRLLDPQGKPVSPGKPGVAWVTGPNLMQEYWHDPQLTHESIVQGWLCTGDLLYQDSDGFYWFYGRLKQIIVRQGDNISPFEIEEVLAKHPAVKISGVIGKPDNLEGELPVAFVVLKNNKQASSQELIQFVADYLEGYKVPVEIHIVESLSLTKSNKIDRKKLKEDYIRSLIK